MTFFSIIIPTYNRAHLITKTIDSVLAQSHPDFEVIIVDDGSTDSTEQVIKERYGLVEKLIYFKKNNEERGVARNFGLQRARGEYAVFFDSDDLMKSHYLETLNKIIIEYPDVKLLAAKYNYENNGKIGKNFFLQNLKEGWYGQDLFFKGNILACNYCIRIKNNNFKFFPPERELTSMEDWLFLLSNLAENKIYIKNETCITMRQHDERSMNNNQKVIEARKKATDWVLKNLALPTSEKKTLIAWSHYFCGIHQYLDHKRGAGLKEAINAIKENGIQKEFLLLLGKSLVGRKFIKAIR